MSPSEQLSHLMRKMLRCLSTHTLLVFRPSTVALALLSLELETLTPGWLRLVLALQRITNVGSEQLMQCREAVGEFLGHTPSLGYVARDRLSSSSAPRSKKRKVAHSSMEDDDVYESIRHLYSDEKSSSCGNCASTTLKASCSLEMHQDTEENTTGLVNSSLLVN